MEIEVSSKEECLVLLGELDEEGRHLHNGLWVRKVIFIEDGSNFVRLQRSRFKDAVDVLRDKTISFPIALEAETAKDYLTLDIEAIQLRDDVYKISFDVTPVKPIKDFLRKDYEARLEDYVGHLRENIGDKTAS